MSTQWKELFEAALSQTIAERLQSRIDDAKAAIQERVNELLDDPECRPEHDEILQAISKLAQVEAQTRRAA